MDRGTIYAMRMGAIGVGVVVGVALALPACQREQCYPPTEAGWSLIRIRPAATLGPGTVTTTGDCDPATCSAQTLAGCTEWLSRGRNDTYSNPPKDGRCVIAFDRARHPLLSDQFDVISACGGVPTGSDVTIDVGGSFHYGWPPVDAGAD